MEIIKIKGCKRCGGDLFLERDCEDTRIICLQCGAVYVNSPVVLEKKPTIKRIYAR
jgi:transcription initiation factor TFIIIB Brf1 subunit/transcription initiation factor TFIIB